MTAPYDDEFHEHGIDNVEGIHKLTMETDTDGTQFDNFSCNSPTAANN